jgi:outer membrane protein
MLVLNRLTLAGIASLSLTAAAKAEDASRWFVHAGPAEVALDTRVKMKAGGQTVPGAAVSVPNQWTVEAEVGYFVTPHIALAFAGGYPPTATINASGSLAGLGKVGQMVYGPMTFNAQYHFNRGGVVQPYVGGGLTAMLVFSTKDAALTNLKVDNNVGADIQIGSDFMFGPHWGAFIDAKKAALRTRATGMLGPAPVVAKVQLDPAVLNAGVVYRF